MNEFIDMRNRYFESMGTESFAEYYLTHHCEISEEDNLARDLLRNRIAALRVYDAADFIPDEELLSCIEGLGGQPYLDRSTVGLLLKHKAQLSGDSIRRALSSLLTSEHAHPERLLHLLDLCMECDMPLLSAERLRETLLRERRNLDALSVLIEYARHFTVEAVIDLLLDWLIDPIPNNIKLQIVDYLVACGVPQAQLSRSLSNLQAGKQEIALVQAYLAFLFERKTIQAPGIVVVQTMFYGDPEDSGKGQSGGLGTLLKSLGNQLSKQPEISLVVTLTIRQDWQDQTPFFQQYNSKHWLVRLPIYCNLEQPHAFVKRELSIKRAVSRFFRQWQLAPDLFHVRYLDNASKAIALLSNELQAKLVFTLTPDPHRNMTDANGNIVCFKVEDTLEKLNKITIGDELLAMTDGIVGIGGEAVQRELQLYFPQLSQRTNQSAFRMIGEGIETDVDVPPIDLWPFLDEHAMGFCIDPDKRTKPVILNVGRLARQKGQHHLLQAWGESQLWRDFSLVIIGGSRASEEEEERFICAFFQTYLAANPNLRGAFAHIEALPNADIRRIERTIAQVVSAKYPPIYLCPSAKEEFGISILEALSEGFLAIAPKKGGVKTYLVDGVNGFLVDTSDAPSLKRDVETVLYHSNLRPEDFVTIQQNGKRTVLDQFSMEEIAKQFFALYADLVEPALLL